MRYFKILLLSCIGLTSLAQDNQTNYEQGKKWLEEEKYTAAMQAFLPLTAQANENVYAEHAHYFYALAAFKDRQFLQSKQMIFQLRQRYPAFEAMREVNYLLAAVLFEEQNPRSALNVLKFNEVSGEDVEAMKVNYYGRISSLDTLIALQRDFPQEKPLARKLALRLRGLNEQKLQMLHDFLVQEYNLPLPQNTAALPYTSVRKKTYKVAVLFPFNLEEKKQTGNYVTELYEGMRMAIDSLEEANFSLQLYAYDTGKDLKKLNDLLALPEMASMDLLIGPLQKNQIPAVNEFAKTNRIPVVHPLSINSKDAEDNDFAFLFQPSLEYQVKNALDFVRTSFPLEATIKPKRWAPEITIERKNVIILYGKEMKDSVMALRYKDSLKNCNCGFQITHFEKISHDKINRIREILSDSTRMVKVNHVFISSGSEVIAANVMNAMEISRQRTPLLVRSEWLTMDLLKYDDFERRNVHFLHPEYLNYSDTAFINFKIAYFGQSGFYPSTYSVTGFELMYIFGSALKKYGTFFKSGLNAEGFHKGKLLYGSHYAQATCNRYLPITRFEDRKLKVMNSPIEIQK